MEGAEDDAVIDGDDGGVSNLDRGASGKTSLDGGGGDGDASFDDAGIKSRPAVGHGMRVEGAQWRWRFVE